MSSGRLLRAALIAAATATMTLTASCAAGTHTPGGGHGGTVFTERDGSDGSTIRIAVGDRVRLVLGSSYWQIRGSSAPAVLRQDGPVRLLPPPPGSCPPGVGCRPVQAYFAAIAPGRAVITAHRQSCGEALRCLGSQGSFRLIVIVR